MAAGITGRAMTINRIADDGQRRLAMRDRQGDVMDDLENLSTVSINITRALADRRTLDLLDAAVERGRI
jgi:hypothetical protein